MYNLQQTVSSVALVAAMRWRPSPTPSLAVPPCVLAMAPTHPHTLGRRVVPLKRPVVCVYRAAECVWCGARAVGCPEVSLWQGLV